MKKIIFLITLLCAAIVAHAYNLDTTATYIYSSDFNQARLGAAVPIGLNAVIGLEGKYVEDKLSTDQGGFKDPIYSLYLPIRLDLDLVKITLSPFYYFKNKSDLALFQDNQAYGIITQLAMNLVYDEVEEHFTQAYIAIAYAHQKGSALDQQNNWSNEQDDQFAYTLGVRQNFYNSFSFQMAGTAYQYPDGVSRIQQWRGILDQKDLAFTQSYDVSRALGKYALSARFARMWQEQRSSLYIGYHYMEFHTADPEHSLVLGNSFYVAEQARVDMAYNHLQNTDGKNKRDLFYINLNIAF